MTTEDFFEDLQNQYSNQLPFVAYKKPNEFQLQSMYQSNSKLNLVVDFTESGFVFAPFDTTEKAILILDTITQKVKFDSSHISQFDTFLKDTVPSETQKQFHIDLVQKAIATIQKNEFQKVVVSRSESIGLSEVDPISIFKKLLYTYPSAFVYCWYHPKVGLWLGATPETLVNVEGNRLTTMALAGTQKYVDAEDVMWPQKEKEEQQFVTDFIVKSLRSSVGGLQALKNDIHISKLETVKAGNLLHLKTEIRANLKPETLRLKQILNNLHPTPAVCGLPKENAKQFILKNENYNREFYTGFLGELNLKEKKSRNINRRNVENNAYLTVKNVSNLYVNLRCVQLKDNEAIIYVGGGITKDSVPENEWEETVSKSQVIKSIL
ncbi:MAG: chorismate-binding protein [Aquaticitalea sp.]